MAKYNFKTTSIEGEHDHQITGYDNDLSYPLECIANEFAERNRLKRIELQITAELIENKNELVAKLLGELTDQV